MKKMRIEGRDLVDLVLSWSLEEVLNVDLYKRQVGKIPLEFESTVDYFKSFLPPLIEETHAALLSSIRTLGRAPVVEISYIMPMAEFELPNDLFYKVRLSGLSTDEPSTQLIPKDLIVLTDKRPNRVDGFNISSEPYIVAMVCKADPDRPNDVIILASKPLFLEDVQRSKNEKKASLFGIYMTNITTNVRIWNSLHLGLKGGNLDLISRVLQRNSEDEGVCIPCRLEESDGLVPHRFLKLNPSQENAILSCLDVRRCHHENTIKMIWGPPGTGKTKTTSVMLFTLLNAKCRTLTCTPTNVSVLEVASRVVQLVSRSLTIGKYGFGDVLLFGNGERMKIKDRRDLVDFFIDERVDKLYPCFMPFYGWKATIDSMIRLLEDPQGHYHQYLENLERVNNVKSKDTDSVFKRKGNDHKKNRNENIAEQVVSDSRDEEKRPTSFQEYLPNRFSDLRRDLELVFSCLCTHLPTTLLLSQAATCMYETIDLVKDATILAVPDGVSGEVLKSVLVTTGSDRFTSEQVTVEDDYLKLLRLIPEIFTLPSMSNRHLIKELCFGHACLLFSTASCSARLYTELPIQLLVIDEAAQLKECETAIPLLLPGIQHSILIGDEKQLPAMVESQIALESGFGRSLFERVSILGHKKYLLNIQYRMHRSISIFPNKEFYGTQIQDAPTVKQRSYTKQYLPGKMYGPYSFINIPYGEEQYGEGRSLKNNVEVAVVLDIIANLLQVSERTKTRINVGVISPYKAQVFAIQQKIQETCSGDAGGLFSLKVRSVDGFQGGEEDIIIVSTVRSNGIGRVGFLADRRRTNVLLTRARFCLWILGDEATLVNSKSLWRNLIHDAKERDCFHNSEEDKSLAQAIASAKIEFLQLNRPLNNSKWKVCFSDEFKKHLEEIKSPEIYRKIKSFLERILQGWFPEEESETDNLVSSSQLLKQSKIDDVIRLIWAVDILKQEFHFVQVLKIWDVVTSSDAPEALKRLDLNQMKYTEDEIEKCRARCFRGDIIVPLRWSVEPTNGNSVLCSSDVMETFGSLNLAGETLSAELSSDSRQLLKDEKEEQEIEIDSLSDLLTSKLFL
ncbi:hypothetical protein EUTSA_v10019511mg [Eutrema salsugineum]|uniref:Helicase ATP-binding domain-containing protein n=1 Tax=Eutrema salsugineum TaxID=72664 RepID=V4KCG0_EUTSA|nr:uncharacterized protein LOC18008385 [Eutrema salsugineum]ESQ28804.1 hypothetical protein EUTSA_v10019511mg [Eutrema salsugineum]